MRLYKSIVLDKEEYALTRLALDILTQVKEEGGTGPLSNYNIETVERTLEKCQTLVTEAEKANKLAHRKNRERDLAFGKAADQYMDTPGHLLFYIGSMRDILLGHYKGRERELSRYGFKVSTHHGNGNSDQLGNSNDPNSAPPGPDSDSDIGNMPNGSQVDEEGVS